MTLKILTTDEIHTLAEEHYKIYGGKCACNKEWVSVSSLKIALDCLGMSMGDL